MTSHCLLICEIGPVFDFVRRSRKTKDYWAASYLLSYLMAEVIKKIQANGGTIFRPNVASDPLVTGIGSALVGSIPDQVFAIVPIAKKEMVRKELDNVIKNAGDDLKSKLEAAAGSTGWFDSTIKLRISDFVEFVNFFFIFHDLGGIEPTAQENIQAENKIKARAMLRRFEQRTGHAEIEKWKKCNLCGDREAVYIQAIGEPTDTTLFKQERICSVCMFKRFLSEALRVPVKFDSTTDIAAVPFFEKTKELKPLVSSSINVKAEYEKVKESYRKCADEARNSDPSLKPCLWIADEDFDDQFGRCLFQREEKPSEELRTLRRAFENLEAEARKTRLDYVPLAWIKRPFYAIVYMDGDGMGDAIKANEEHFARYVQGVARILSKFSHEDVLRVVGNHHGQVIYAGGDDVNFLIHPEYLLEAISELTVTYNNSFKQDDLTRPNAEILTLSAGAVVCYHKYPLSEAIRRAYNVMTRHAKAVKGKNATAIQLIKGHTETLTFAIPNAMLGNVTKLKQEFQHNRLSRGTPHRIASQREVLEILYPDPQAFVNYLVRLLSGTRDGRAGAHELRTLANVVAGFAYLGVTPASLSSLSQSEKAANIQTMIDVLLFVRFLTGE